MLRKSIGKYDLSYIYQFENAGCSAPGYLYVRVTREFVTESILTYMCEHQHHKQLIHETRLYFMEFRISGDLCLEKNWLFLLHLDIRYPIIFSEGVV